MSLIIKDKIQMLMKGYPTVSDKYNVAGGTLVGATAVKFGELVKHSDTTGYYEAITGATDVDKIAGFVLATNVKLNTVWPEGGVEVAPNEAFNLLINGYIAVELAEDAIESEIVVNKPVAFNAAGKVTTAGASGATELPGVVFTGTYEKQGTSIIAEVLVK